MLLVAPPFFKVASGFVAPSRTLTTKGFFGGAVVGYIRSGGYVAGQLGDSGGTLSGNLLLGFTTDTVIKGLNGSSIDIWFVGDATTDLVGCTGIKINTTVYEIMIAADYDSENDITGIGFDGSSITLTAPTTYTVQLV